MVKRLLINTLIPLGLAGAFYVFFMTTKHDAALSQIIPFAFDPYDAIGSFALETAVFLGILSFIRTIRLYRKGKPEREQQVFLARAQMGVALAVFLTLVGDTVAMLRHLTQWTGRPATGELVLFLVGMVFCALVVGLLVSFSARTIGLPHIPGVWKRGETCACSISLSMGDCSSSRYWHRAICCFGGINGNGKRHTVLPIFPSFSNRLSLRWTGGICSSDWVWCVKKTAGTFSTALVRAKLRA